MTSAQLILYGLLAGGGLWVLHKIGQFLTKVLEAAAAIAVVFLTLWLLVKGVWRTGRWLVRHWRTTITTAALLAWWHWWGWPSLAITAGVVALGLVGWRWLHRDTFEPWTGRWLRGWWWRWAVYARRMPGWLRACHLTVADPGQPVTVQVTPFRRTAVAPKVKPRRDQVPRVIGVRSGPSWDEVKVRLVPGQTPEDFDLAARALAVARGVARCQVRELAPDVVSIDYQRRDRLASIIVCRRPADLVQVSGEDVDLTRVWSGRTEYGRDWYQSLVGGHTLVAGATGAGKNSHGWCPSSPSPRTSATALCGCPGSTRRAWSWRTGGGSSTATPSPPATPSPCWTTSSPGMEARKLIFAGSHRMVPISREHPVELLEFDEIGALIRYVGDRKTREAIIDRVALLNTQGRALGFTVRGYVQEPTKDTVPVRELFPRRICLRVASKTHVAMVLGDQAYDRGAWANRIGESEPGIGYLFGEGIREPLRVRAGWVSDDTIKELEAFVTGAIPTMTSGQVLVLPAPAPLPRPQAGGAA